MTPIDFDQYRYVLTPNQRLSQILQADYDSARLKQGDSAWRPPTIVPIGEFWLNLWCDSSLNAHSGLKPAFVLSDGEQLELWRQSVEHCFDGVLLSGEGAARDIMQAANALWNWGVDAHEVSIRRAFELSRNTELFLRCFDWFEQRVASLGAISAGALPATLAQSSVKVEGRVLLYGFDEVPPVHIKALSALGAEFDPFLPWQGGCSSRPNAQLHVCMDTEDEFQKAALWAKDLQANADQGDIVIVVPELLRYRSRISHILSQVLDTQYFDPHTPRTVPPFAVSGGGSLLDAPIVNAALSFLDLGQRPVDISQLPNILYSPFFPWVEKDGLQQLCSLEKALRARRLAQFDLGMLLFEASRESGEHGQPLCGQLANGLQALRTLSRLKPKSPIDGLEAIDQCLEQVQWAATRTLDSIEFQQLQHLQQAKEELIKLLQLRFNIDQSCSMRDILNAYRQVLREQLFQAESLDTRVRVLGQLEAAGQQFKHAWICQMSASNWPQAATPSPYLPIALQRELRMPHCDAGKELQFSEQLLANYAFNIEDMHLSYPASLDDNPNQLSALLSAFNLEVIDTRDERISAEALSSEVMSTEVECKDDSRAPVLDKGQRLRRIVAILEDQAACPFRAFGHHRLGLRALDQSDPGLGNLLTGDLVHHCLDAVWNEIGSSTTLTQMSPSALEQLVDQCISSVIETFRRQGKVLGREAYLPLERKRLQPLLLRWLALESKRDEFEVLESEVHTKVEMLGTEFSLRIDRLDRNSEGGLEFIEYKTGAVSASALGQPLRKPQLPLYATRSTSAQSGPVHGVALCSVQSLEPKWIGMGSTHSGRPRELEWGEQLDMWEAELFRLEQEFASGVSDVAPIERGECRHCDLSSLCRISDSESQSMRGE